jgi:hypothetical protein
MRLYPRVTHVSTINKQHNKRDGMAKKKAVKETFIEPDVKWKKSKAKRLLYKDIVEGKVPL